MYHAEIHALAVVNRMVTVKPPLAVVQADADTAAREWTAAQAAHVASVTSQNAAAAAATVMTVTINGADGDTKIGEIKVVNNVNNVVALTQSALVIAKTKADAAAAVLPQRVVRWRSRVCVER